MQIKEKKKKDQWLETQFLSPESSQLKRFIDVGFEVSSDGGMRTVLTSGQIS